MDEPCSALDPISTLAIEDLIGELKERFTIVIVTHNMQQAARVSDRTAFFNLAGGRPARQADRDRRDRADLLQPVGPGHRGLHLRPLRLSHAAGPTRPAVLHGGATARRRARPLCQGAGPFRAPVRAVPGSARCGGRGRPAAARSAEDQLDDPVSAPRATSAAAGIVMNQPSTMFLATPQRTALTRLVAPTPMIAEVITWVVEIGAWKMYDGGVQDRRAPSSPRRSPAADRAR